MIRNVSRALPGQKKLYLYLVLSCPFNLQKVGVCACMRTGGGLAGGHAWMCVRACRWAWERVCPWVWVWVDPFWR